MNALELAAADGKCVWPSHLRRCYFALISLSGVFAVTFSVIFAYVADVTEEQERSTAYGLVGLLSS